MTGQSFARELMSAALIIVGPTFYRNVGYPESTTILASLAVVLGVTPFIFYRYGHRIRENSNYSQEVSAIHLLTQRRGLNTLCLQIKAAARKEAERARLLESMGGTQ